MSIKILIILAIPNFMSKIPSNIKFLRKKKGLTQQQFADSDRYKKVSWWALMKKKGPIRNTIC